MTLARLARLLGPPDGSGYDVVDAGRRWDALPAAGHVLWGRPPAPPGTPPGEALRHALRRERALGRVRARFRDTRTTRWAPPDLGGRPEWNALRSALLSGAVVEIDPPRERLLDVAATAAGAAPVARFRPSSGGALLASVEVGGTRALLRVGGERTRPPHLPLVPRVLAHGEVGGAAWSAETLLPGRRPRRVTKPLWDACVELCAALPAADAPDALRDDVEELAASLPDLASELRAAGSEAWARLSRLGGAARHGDLWRPNLLAARGDLTGVVDWDAWHPAAAPGVDLLNLWATERHGPGLGDAWRHRPWRAPELRAATEAYWSRRGLDPAPHDWDAIAVAWWAGQAAASLRRLPHVARRPAWVEGNVAAVLREL